MITTQPSKKKHDEKQGKLVHLSAEKGSELGSTLVEIRMKQKEHQVEAEAKKHGARYINLQKFPMVAEALTLLDRQFCEQERVVCFYFEGDQIRLGTTNPDNPRLKPKIEEIEKNFRAEVNLYFISEESLQAAFKRYDAIPKPVKSRDEGIELTEQTLKRQQEKFTSIQKLNEVIAKTPVTEVLALIVSSAIKSGASDIHIESEVEDIKIRLRVDGVLHDIGTLPTEAWGRIISRIKLLAGLKINIFDKPQDGRFTIYIEKDRIEVRVSTVPTSYGESVVMRLLRFSISALKFNNLGLTGYTYTKLDEEITKPNGMIIATGPTGSGKTTTLYAILHKLNNPKTKILTLEDPVEYKIEGVNQTQVNPEKGFDFAKGLRSVLRQDPDIIMVGEIRDLETADTSINAALTGHLMLSTLHTNSAAGAIPRLLAMGSKNFLLAPSINALIGQRLVRRLCQSCKTPETLKEKTKARVKKALENLKDRDDLDTDKDISNPDKLQFYSAPGCDECSGLAYKGRIGIFEIMTMNKDLEKIILAGSVSEYETQETAQAHGMVTMVQDGILKAIEGITSVEEVFRQAE